MLRNCGTNLIRNEFKLLDDHPRLEKNLPAFIVGSGPSLDQSIAAIKRLQGQAIVFSCGTGLLPLLRNGGSVVLVSSGLPIMPFATACFWQRT